MWKWYEIHRLVPISTVWVECSQAHRFVLSAAVSVLWWQMNSCDRDHVPCEVYYIYSLVLCRNICWALVWRSGCVDGDDFGPSLSLEDFCAGVSLAVKSCILGEVREVTLVWDLCPPVALKAIVNQGQTHSQTSSQRGDHATVSIKVKLRGLQPCAESTGGLLFAIYYRAVNIQRSKK